MNNAQDIDFLRHSIEWLGSRGNLAWQEMEEAEGFGQPQQPSRPLNQFGPIQTPDIIEGALQGGPDSGPILLESGLHFKIKKDEKIYHINHDIGAHLSERM